MNRITNAYMKERFSKFLGSHVIRPKPSFNYDLITDLIVHGINSKLMYIVKYRQPASYKEDYENTYFACIDEFDKVYRICPVTNYYICDDLHLLSELMKYNDLPSLYPFKTNNPGEIMNIIIKGDMIQHKLITTTFTMNDYNHELYTVYCINPYKLYSKPNVDLFKLKIINSL